MNCAGLSKPDKLYIMKIHKALRPGLLLAFNLLVAAAISASGQSLGTAKALPVNVSEHKLESKLMDRQMPYRVILPSGYSDAKNSSKRYPTIYLLHGLTGHYDNWTTQTGLAKYAETYQIIIVTPEGDNGWYTDSVSNPNEKYESYIVKELVPEIDSKFRTISDRAHRAIGGLSMGGYGAIKFGLKYPGMFRLAGSFSGALRAAQFSEKNSGAIGKAIANIFGPEGSEIRLNNDIFRLVTDITPEKVKDLPFIYLDCGTEDFIFSQSRDFSALLIEKKIPHEFRELPGGHTWPYWDRQVQEFLRLADRLFGPN